MKAQEEGIRAYVAHPKSGSAQQAPATNAERIIEERIAAADELTLEMVDQRSLPIRLRDGIARLWSPYL